MRKIRDVEGFRTKPKAVMLERNKNALFGMICLLYIAVDSVGLADSILTLWMAADAEIYVSNGNVEVNRFRPTALPRWPRR